MKTVKEMKIDHQKFLNQIPESLAWIEKNVVKETVSYSFDEIEKVHLFYEKNPNNHSDESLKQAFITYMGEAFIKYFGGNWELSKMTRHMEFLLSIIGEAMKGLTLQSVHMFGRK